jgi:hypothetical protein
MLMMTNRISINDPSKSRVLPPPARSISGRRNSLGSKKRSSELNLGHGLEWEHTGEDVRERAV